MMCARLPMFGTITVMLLSCGVAIAGSNEPSASYFMPGCRDAASLITFSVRDSEEEAASMNFCAGILVGLSFMGELHGICVPPEATSQKAASIVVQYIDGQPARTDEDFRSFAVEALRANWPCPPSNPSGRKSAAG
jgi:Rap1a immunity proteins